MATEDSKVVCTNGGPNLVHGVKTVTKVNGEIITVEEGKPVALCACGKSQNAPFCDGSHRTAKPTS